MGGSKLAALPLYLDVCHNIMRDIRDGMYPENSALPSERLLCEKYHVSRSTIRSAMELLKKTGTVYSHQGRGTFVKPFVYVQNLTEFYSFTKTLKESNVIIENSVIDYTVVTANEALAAAAGYPTGTTLHRLLRLRSARRCPLMLETSYLPTSRFKTLEPKALEQGSLYDYLRSKYSLHVDRAVETFRPVMPDAEERGRLQIPPATPCMLLERFSYENGETVEYTRSTVRGDKYVFRSELVNRSPTDEG